MSPETRFADALLLRRIPYGEADVVATLLTPTMGRVGALARAARSSRKRFGGAFDFFNLLTVELSAGRSGMPKLLSVELTRPFDAIRRDLDRFAAGSHFLEVARLGTREDDPAPEFFALLHAALDTLNAGADVTSLIRVFQIRWLAAMGYGLHEAACSACAAPSGEGEAVFQGFAPLCPACRKTSGHGGDPVHTLAPGAAKTLRAAAELPLERLGTLKISPAMAAQLTPLLEGALTRALGAAPKTTGAL